MYQEEYKGDSTVISDCWKTYNCLGDVLFHPSVSHNVSFKDPETRAHTNSLKVCRVPLKNLCMEPAGVRIKLILTLQSSCGENCVSSSNPNELLYCSWMFSREFTFLPSYFSSK
ncbi:hypothetical protein TNCV_2910481 [Trichonephila clavipes]|nr:hypothetical protein TNCV_2910481 [Trichonephila clavipes]